MSKLACGLVCLALVAGCVSERSVKAPTPEFPVFGPYMTKDGNMLRNPLAWSQPMATPSVVWNPETKNYTIARASFSGSVTLYRHFLLSEALLASSTYKTALKGELSSPEVRRGSDGVWRLYATMKPEGSQVETLAVFKSNTADSWSDYSFECWLQKDVASKDPTVFAYRGKTYLACVEGGAVVIRDLVSDTKFGTGVCRVPRTGLSGNPFAIVSPAGRLFVGYTAGTPMTDDATLKLVELNGTNPLAASDWKSVPGVFLAKGNGFYGPCEASAFLSPDGRETWLAYQAFEYDPEGRKSWPLACLEKVTFGADGRPKPFVPARPDAWRNCPSGEPPFQATR